MSAEQVKRKRSPNWHPLEKLLLLTVVEDSIKIIENKKTDNATTRLKNRTWEEAANIYNSHTTMVHRTAANLKTEWELLKKSAKKDLARRKAAEEAGTALLRVDDPNDPLYAKILYLIQSAAVSNRLESSIRLLSQPPETADASSKSSEGQQQDGNSNEAEDDSELNSSLEGAEEQLTQSITALQKDPGSVWSLYTPRLLQTPFPKSLIAENVIIEETGCSDEQSGKNETNQNNSSSLPKPPLKKSSLDKLREQKIQALKLRMKLAEQEREERKAAHQLDLDQKRAAHQMEMAIKLEMLRQEQIKTELLSLEKKRKDSQ